MSKPTPFTYLLLNAGTPHQMCNVLCCSLTLHAQGTNTHASINESPALPWSDCDTTSTQKNWTL